MSDQNIWKELIESILNEENNAAIKAEKLDFEETDHWLCKLNPSGKIVKVEFADIELKPEQAKELEKFSALEELILSHNNLIDLPIDFSNLRYLKRLSVKNNKLNRMPRLNALGELRFLNLYGNEINSISREISNLKKLQHLDLSNNNALNGIDEIKWSNLTELIDLRLSHTRSGLGSVPDSIGYLTKLRYLSLGWNSLESLPNTIGQLTELEGLELQKNDLSALPDGLDKLSKLSSLYLNDNKFQEFPRSVLQLGALKHLRLNKNQIEKIPKETSSLVSLEYLNLNDNCITVLPYGLFASSALKTLSVKDNEIEQFPEIENNETSYLLESLDLSNNKLKNIPKALEKLKKLKALNFSDNVIENIETDFNGFKQLETVDLSNNSNLSLADIPSSLLNHKGLISLGLKGSGVRIPEEVLTESPQSISTYAKTLVEQGSVPFNEGKLIILGNEMVGKTSLVHRLKYDEFLDPKLEDRTKGIKLSDLMIDTPDGQVRLNIWDFGGQEIMHSMHEFFMTQRTIYILACPALKKSDTNASSVEKVLIYWLDLINTFGGDSPIIVVSTKVDEDDSNYDLNFTGIREKYRNRNLKFVRTSAKNGKNIHLLKTEIENVILNMKSIRDQFGKNDLEVKQCINELFEPDQPSSPFKSSISKEEYHEICIEKGIKAPESQEKLLTLLDKLGIVFYFNPTNDDKRTIEYARIFNPHWVTKGIYSLVNDEGISQNYGIFKYADLASLLKPEKLFVGKENQLLKLMESRDMVAKFGDQGEYIIASASSDAESRDAAKEFNINSKLKYYYEYPKGTPKYPRVISKLLVNNLIHFSRGQDQLDSYWKDGVIINLSNRNKIKAHISKENIQILEIEIIGHKDKESSFLNFHKQFMENMIQSLGAHQPKLYIEGTDGGFSEITSIEEYAEKIKKRSLPPIPIPLTSKDIREKLSTMRDEYQEHLDYLMKSNSYQLIKTDVVVIVCVIGAVASLGLYSYLSQPGRTFLGLKPDDAGFFVIDKLLGILVIVISLKSNLLNLIIKFIAKKIYLKYSESTWKFFRKRQFDYTEVEKLSKCIKECEEAYHNKQLTEQVFNELLTKYESYVSY